MTSSSIRSLQLRIDILSALLRRSFPLSRHRHKPQMAADTMTSPPSIASHIVVGGESGAVNGSELPLQDEGDNRSSSLSDLGERAGHDEAEEDFGESSDGNDTEAETERLEESPPKNRRQENIVLTTANNLYGERQGQMSLPVTRGTPRILGTDRTRRKSMMR